MNQPHNTQLILDTPFRFKFAVLTITVKTRSLKTSFSAWLTTFQGPIWLAILCGLQNYVHLLSITK
jgi:hypothetical protein